MCAAFELNSRVYRPGKIIAVKRAKAAGLFPWAGFAQAEKLAWWTRQGAELVDIPAWRFAERSDRTRKLIWDLVPPGEVVRGLLVPSAGEELVKVVTRAADPAELARFEHPRMPLLEVPLFGADPIPEPPLDPPAAQGELFG